MRDFSVSTEQVEILLRSALSLSDIEVIRVKPIDGPNRNSVHRILEPCSAYLKIFPPGSSCCAGGLEASVATALRGLMPVPRILAHGFSEELGLPFVVSAAQEGTQLNMALGLSVERDLQSLFSEIAVALKGVARNPELIGILRRLSHSATGPHAADYCPAEWVMQNDDYFQEVVDHLAPVERGIVLGSLSMNNLLVRNSTGVLSLSSFIDFEGARIGPLGFDQAMLWYDLVLDGRLSLADAWAKTVAYQSDASILSGMVVNAAWLSAFRSSHPHAERENDAAIRPAIKKKLMQLREMFVMKNMSKTLRKTI